VPGPVRRFGENIATTGIRCVRGLDIKTVGENKFFIMVQVNITVFWYVASRNSIDTCLDVEKNFCCHLQRAVKSKAVIPPHPQKVSSYKPKYAMSQVCNHDVRSEDSDFLIRGSAQVKDRH